LVKTGKRQTVKGIFGILVLLLAIFAIVVWENGGRQALTYTDALVMARDVLAGETVTRDMLGTMRIENDISVKNPPKPDDVIGRVTAVDIPAGLQLTTGFFLPEDGLDDGERVFALPTAWVYSCPRTIRQGDTVYFYPLKETEILDEEGNVEVAMSGGNRSVLSAKVAYVKDSSNREVIDVTPVRIDASADTSTFEIIIDDKGYSVIFNYVTAGHKFNLMYR
jgi:hypothetical protein